MGREIGGLALAATAAGLVVWLAVWLGVREQWGPFAVLVAALACTALAVAAMRYDPERKAERAAIRDVIRERRRLTAQTAATAAQQAAGPTEARTLDGRTAMPTLPPRDGA